MRTSSLFPVKAAIALAVTAAGSALVIGFQPPQAAVGSTPAAGTSSAAAGSTHGRSSTTAATAQPGAAGGTSAGAGGASGSYKDGTYTGAASQDPFGVVQVAVTVSGGKITDVQTIQQPGDRRSTRINAQALPILHDQAIASQSAQVDGVSGATWTSQAYSASLQAALDQAKG